MTIALFKKILGFYWTSKTKYGAHSPFLYDFVKNIMNTEKRINTIDNIESVRKSLLNRKDSINFIELGAGSKAINGNMRKVSDVAKSSLSGKWQCRILYNLVQHYKCNNIIEIGTSLGISTAYLSAANSNCNIITLEGNPSSVTIAKEVFGKLNCKNIDIVEGNFDSTLNDVVQFYEQVDLAFIDGNHRYQATIDYYNILKQNSTKSSIFIIDDIYWSEEMNQAWQEIIHDNDVGFSIDLFRMGIVFFDTEKMEKQHFKLIDYIWKPWSIGLY
ncbi:MAG: class I SAM-dependent methyltransferase [Saprospiraceae bacterium]